MRGKGDSWDSGAECPRITPAYAGKSQLIVELLSCYKDHPRVCGEKGCCKFSSRNHSGSPPHVRGKVFAGAFPIIGIGITPAYAGKSTPGTLKPSEPWDHPHMCGEKLRKTAILARELGSPPHMRGKESHARRKRQAHGITPAHAGKSPLWRPVSAVD